MRTSPMHSGCICLLHILQHTNGPSCGVYVVSTVAVEDPAKKTFAGKETNAGKEKYAGKKTIQKKRRIQEIRRQFER